jgi:hypothetical protein
MILDAEYVSTERYALCSVSECRKSVRRLAEIEPYYLQCMYKASLSFVSGKLHPFTVRKRGEKAEDWLTVCMLDTLCLMS